MANKLKNSQLKCCHSYINKYILKIYNNQINFFLKFEDAAKEIADEITRPRPDGEEHVKNIQVMLRSEANPIFIRQLTVISCFFFIY